MITMLYVLSMTILLLNVHEPKFQLLVYVYIFTLNTNLILMIVLNSPEAHIKYPCEKIRLHYSN